MARVTLVAVLTTMIALGIGASAPAVILADDDIPVSATSTYALVPDRGEIAVTVVLKVTNRIPDTVKTVPCAGGTCKQTTRYYVNEAWIWVENEATDLKVTADSGKVTRKADEKSEYLTSYKLRFRDLYRGATRTLTVTYRIPGGAPRSEVQTRAGAAFASFCGISQATDVASVRVTVPTGFEMTTTGGDLATRQEDGRTVYESGRIADPTEYWFCMSGSNADGYATATDTSPGGQLIRFEAWPEDPDWMAGVQEEAARALARLESLFGLPIPGSGEIVIRETSAQDLGAYGGVYASDERLASIGEAFDEAGLVAHELAHAWFNEQLFKEVWLDEGYAGWVEQAASSEPSSIPRCRAPGTFPGTGTPTIRYWLYLNPRSTDLEDKLVDYQYGAACSIVTDVTTWIGEDRMRDVLAAVDSGTSPYVGAGELPAGRDGPSDWRAWLDAVDEIGMVPSGETDLGRVTDLLVRYGAVAERDVEGREEARVAYHALIDAADGWDQPLAVRRPLDEWDFEAARSAIDIGSATDAAVDRTEALLPEIDPSNGPVREAFETAQTLDDLVEARELAQAQAEAAAAVRSTLDAVAAPREPLESLGLIEVDLEPMTTAAISAVAAADKDTANAEVARINELLDGAGGAGALRLAAILGSVAALVLLLVAVAMVVRRRRAGVPESTVVPPIDQPARSTLQTGPADASPQESALATTSAAMDHDLEVSSDGPQPGGEAGQEPTAPDQGGGPEDR